MEKNKVLCFYLSEEGKKIAEGCRAFFRAYLGEAEILPFKKEELKDYFSQAKLLVFVMALGIVVRSLAPFLTKKGKDPGVIVIDEAGRHVIPLVGGHAQRTNEISQDLALFLGAQPVITTASDLKGLPALDLWLKDLGFHLKNPENFPKVMANLNAKRELKVYLEERIDLPLLPYLSPANELKEAELIITYKLLPQEEMLFSRGKLKVVPPILWVGMGFHDGLREEDFAKILDESLTQHGLDPLAIKGIATLKRKASYEPLQNFCLRRGYKLLGFGGEELKKVSPPNPSLYVEEKVGVNSVAEASALLASRGELLLTKIKGKDYTLAVALSPYRRKGKLYLIGIGPGDLGHLTIRALQALHRAQTIIGYKTYLRLIQPLLQAKEVFSFGMTEEVERARLAIDLALQGKEVALISGGDPGIYGMAVLALELLTKGMEDLEVEVIPGISSLNAGASLCGAPLANDFAVISLSDRLTPLEVIEKRLESFLQADVPLVIFNPRSKGRIKPLKRAIEILIKKGKEEAPVAILTNIGREGEVVHFTRVKDIPLEKITMNSLLIVGSTQTKITNLWMLTRRGYERKYQL